jgi:hypothetical protein
MKKTTLNILLLLTIIFISSVKAQTFSTGLVTASANLSFKVDVTATEVTLTITGDSSRWLAVGFGGTGAAGNGMGNQLDVVYTNASFNIVDARLQGFVVPSTDSNQDWTEISNNVVGSIRTIVATRDLNTGEIGDYVFSTSDTSLNYIVAHGSSGDNTVSNHNVGDGFRQASTTLITLGMQDYTLNDKFAIYPNPSNGNVNIKSDGFSISSISIIDMQGRLVKKIETTSLTSITPVDLTSLSSGIYNMIVEADGSKGMKKILIN